MKIQWWKLLGLILFLFLVMQPMIEQFLFAARISTITEPVSEYGKRLACISEALPVRGEIGFLYNTEQSCSPSDARCISAYYQAAYFLVPRVVVQGINYDWVVVQMNDKVSVDQIEARYLLSLEKICGKGLALFKRVKK